MSNELIKIQQGIIKLIGLDIDETKTLIKKVKKDVKKTGFIEIQNDMKSIIKDFEKNLASIQHQLRMMKFKSATPDSIVAMRKFASTVKEQKELLIVAYRQISERI